MRLIIAMISSSGSRGGSVRVPGGGVPKSQDADEELVDMDRSCKDKDDDAADRDNESIDWLVDSLLPRSMLPVARPVCPLDHCVFGVLDPLVAFTLEKGCRPRLTGREAVFILP